MATPRHDMTVILVRTFITITEGHDRFADRTFPIIYPGTQLEDKRCFGPYGRIEPMSSYSFVMPGIMPCFAMEGITIEIV